MEIKYKTEIKLVVVVNAEDVDKIGNELKSVLDKYNLLDGKLEYGELDI